MKKIKTLLASALLLSACDTKDTTPLPGTRESFLNFTSTLRPEDPTKKIVVSLPTATANTSWTQAGGEPSHAAKNVALGKTLSHAWKMSVGVGASDEQKILASPIADENAVYAMDAQGKITAIKVPGTAEEEPTVLWSMNTAPEDREDDALGGGIALDKGIIYAATSFGEIKAINAKTGEIVWGKSNFSPFRSAPTIYDGRVMAQSISNELVALSADKGETLWTHDGVQEQAQLLVGTAPAAIYDTVIVAYSSGEVHALNNSTGQVLWSDTITPVARIDTVTSIPHITALPVISGNQVFIISHGGRMTALDLKSGSRQWQKEIGGIHTPAVIDNYVFVLSNLGEAVCLDRNTGAILWATKLPVANKDDAQPYYTGPVLAGSTLVFTSSLGEILRLDVNNGQIVETIKIDGAPELSPIVANNTLFVETSDAVIHAFR